MTEKQQLIQAFKTLDFEALYHLLDDNRSYMSVSKDLFLSTLKKELNEFSELKSFDEVVKGICDYCNKGCKAYRFKTKSNKEKSVISLPLFFEEENDKVTDIYLCNTFKEDKPNKDERNTSIYFYFYEDEYKNFKPTTEYTINLQKIEKAVEEFNNLKSRGLVSVEDVVYWYNKHKVLVNDLDIDFDIPFEPLRYKAYEYLDYLYKKTSDLVHNYNRNHLAEKLLDEYNKVDTNDERSIVKWLMENKENYFYSLKKTDNWKETGILILETKPNLVVDCNGYLDSFLLDEIYYNHYFAIMEKYEPTKEHYEQNGSIEYSLESRLRVHNKYLDLL